MQEPKKLFGKLILIVGPSGSGKGSVIDALKMRYPGFVYPVSCTTRPMREGEEDGEVYYFISKEEFEEKIKNDEFLEYALVHNLNYYGTLKKDILGPLEAGAFVIREVDMQGFELIRGVVPKENLMSIFIDVENLDVLRGRIEQRGKLAEEEIAKRLESAEHEIAKKTQCDFIVMNREGLLSQCLRETEAIILKSCVA